MTDPRQGKRGRRHRRADAAEAMAHRSKSRACR